jgi:hypothetical protein
MKTVQIFGGGTIAHIANHFAICAPAYGATANLIAEKVSKRFNNEKRTISTVLNLTKMAGGNLETNEDVAAKVDEIVADLNTKIVFFNCALVDWQPVAVEEYRNRGTEGVTWQGVLRNCGKYASRIESRDHLSLSIEVERSNKVISRIRENRKDIFLVAFKTTCGASRQEMYEKGLRLCKEASANLVLVNDTKTRWNMIITPEEAAYHETENRDEAISNLVDMAWYRSHLTFTRSTVVEGKPVSWFDERVPEALRKAVDFCIASDAYKPFGDSTVGHFATKLSDTEFLTSIRRSNFNDLHKNGLVYVRTDGPDTVLAYGSKPNVGGQSQRIIFKDHAGYDCVLHFHSPLRPDAPDSIPVVSQREVECGSHQCGKNTSDNLKQFGNLKAVMLDNHGPNIIFSKDIDPQEVIDFVSRNFDLSQKTGGYNLNKY